MYHDMIQQLLQVYVHNLVKIIDDLLKIQYLSYNIEYRYTAEQALTHPWLAVNCDPEILQKAKDGARGVGVHVHEGEDGPEPMQM